MNYYLVKTHVNFVDRLYVLCDKKPHNDKSSVIEIIRDYFVFDCERNSVTLYKEISESECHFLDEIINIKIIYVMYFFFT